MKNLVKNTLFIVALSGASLFSEYSLIYKGVTQGDLVLDQIFAQSTDECKKACIDGGGVLESEPAQGAMVYCKCKGATKYTIPEVKIPNDVTKYTYSYATAGKTIAQADKDITNGCSKLCVENGKKSAPIGRNGKTYQDDELLAAAFEKRERLQGAVISSRIDCYCK